MLIRDVLDATQLRVKTLYAADDVLDRTVNWTFTTDLLDPRRYLIRGQLVMTGLVWRRSPEDSETFVSSVSQAGAIALMAGEGLYGHIPEDVIEACRRHDLPLFAVPTDVSFASITAYISNALANDRVTRVMASLTRQRELLTEIYRGQLLDDLISRTSRDLGRPIWMVTATGRHVVHPAEPLDERDLEQVVAAALSAHRMPVTITDSNGGRLIVFAVSGLDEHRAAAWFLVVAGDWNEWHPLILDTASELTAVAGLYRVQSSGRAEVSTALVDRLVTLIDSDSEQPESAVYLRQVGIPPDQRSVVIAVEFPGHAELQDLALFLLGDAISHVAPPVVGRDGKSRVVALLAVGEPSEDRTSDLAVVQQALRRIAPGLGGHSLRVGISQSAGVGELGGALRSARFALTLPDARPVDVAEVRINDAEELTSAVQLLAAVPDHLRRVFVEFTLGPVTEHDTRYNSQLMSTLATFLDCGGSWVRTAEVTHLHLNTVRYRMSRIEELTGRDLSSTADRADLYLALKLA